MKKIVAKEFLILLSVLTISLITFPITYSYNTYLSYKKEILEDSIHNTPLLWKENYTSLRDSFEIKSATQRRVFDIASKHFSDVGYGKVCYSSYFFWNNMNRFFKKNKSENVYEDWKNFILFHNNQLYLLNEEKIPTNPDGFKNFIFSNLVTKEDLNNNKLSWQYQLHRMNIQNRIYELIEKMISKNEQIKIALNTFYIFFSIAFILRFLVVSIKWSIKEIKS